MKSGSYCIKNLIHGIQVTVETHNHHQALTEKLRKSGIQFFTYNTYQIRMNKYVLHGLNNEDIGDVKADLARYGLQPADIKLMTIKRPKYDNHTNYLVFFDSEDHITMRVLENAKYIRNTVVRWSPYRKPESKCTQCRNCYRFGHGSTTCHMTPRCMFCSLDHATNDCPLLEQRKRMNAAAIDERLLKCPNCAGNHTAVFIECPSRQKYNQKKRIVAPAPLPIYNTPKPIQGNKQKQYTSMEQTTTPAPKTSNKKQQLLQQHRQQRPVPATTNETNQVPQPIAQLTADHPPTIIVTEESKSMNYAKIVNNSNRHIDNNNTTIISPLLPLATTYYLPPK